MRIKKSGLATDSIILSFVQCFTYVSTIIQTMILSRTLSKTDYGTYSQGLLVVNFIAPFLLLGLSNATNYFYNKREKGNAEEIHQDINSIYVLIIGLGITGGVFILIFHRLIVAYFSNEGLQAIIMIFSFRPLLKNLLQYFQVLYVSSGRAKIIAIRNSIISIVQILIVTLTIYFFNNIMLVCILLVITDLLQVIAFHAYFNISEFAVKMFIPQKATITRIMSYALPLALSTAVGSLMVNMDTMMIGRVMSTESFALYSNMAKELPFNLIISSFATVIYPKIVNFTARGKTEKMIHTYRRYFEFGLISTWILVFGAIVIARELILILYSNAYIDGMKIFVVYLLVSGIHFTYYGTLLTANGDTMSIFRYSLISLIVNLILNIVLFYCLGIIGPAIATLINDATNGFLQIHKGTKILNIRIRDIIDVRFTLRFFLVAITISSVLYYIKPYAEWMPVILRGVIFFSITTGILVLINVKRIVFNLRELNKIK